MVKTLGSSRRSVAFHAASLLLGCWTVLRPAQALESANCRELEHRFDLIKADLDHSQLNSALFSATQLGCQELARTLLDAGASLEARDSLGAAPLALAARAG
jgi:ankyrin repeat protein